MNSKIRRRNSIQFLVSFQLAISICYFSGCKRTYCYFDISSCKITLTNEVYYISRIDISHDKKDYMIYDLLENHKGTNEFNLCSPDTINYTAKVKNNLIKEGSYVMQIYIASSDKFKDQFILFVTPEDWQSSKIIKAKPLRM